MTHLRFDFQHLNNTTDIKRGFIGSIIGEFWGQKSVRGNSQRHVQVSGYVALYIYSLSL